MIDTMEFKDTLLDTTAIFSDIFSNLANVETTINSLDDLLSQSLWIGEAKDKCVQIQGLLVRYYKAVKALIEPVQSAVESLENDMQGFPQNSDSIKMISAI